MLCGRNRLLIQIHFRKYGYYLSINIFSVDSGLVSFYTFLDQYYTTKLKNQYS